MINLIIKIFLEKINYIECDLEGKILNEEFFAREGLKPHDDFFYRELELLGEGSFGSVKKCMDIRSRKLIAVKKITMNNKNGEINEKKREDNASSFLIESKILKRLQKIRHPFIASLEGEFYTLDSKGEIQELVLLTEAGDFSLGELIECRKKLLEKQKAPYDPLTVIAFLKQILPAYECLKDQRVYHADTKINNIIYSIEKMGFIVIDFGVANVIDECDEKMVDEGISCGSYIRGGTKEYNSPEKKHHLKNRGDNKDRLFNPYKCDMWSLAIVIEKMALPIDEGLPGGVFLKKLLRNIKEDDWRERYDVSDMCRLINEYNFALPKIEDAETPFVQILTNKRREDHSKMIRLFQEAYMPEEELEMAKLEFLEIQKEHGPLGQKNAFLFEASLKHLGF